MSDPISRLNAALEGRYRVESKLGEGGMATVYLADDLKHERKVALKVLKPELAAVVGAERFLNEIKTTANLQHPHILGLHDSGEADGLLFYVMPYVEGESLRERLDREHQLPVDDAVRIATNVAEALDYAHRQGVIHRDIKPANILLQDGKPVISDFGIALAVSAGGGGRLTETGLSLGTPHYMSPEQATGDAHVGAATDVYALGCVLYEMLLGEPPFTGNTPQAVLGKIVMGQTESVSAQRRAVPVNVDNAIATALEKLPADRFATPQDFTTALADGGFRRRAGADAGPLNPTGPRVAAVLLMLVATSVAYLAGRMTGSGGDAQGERVSFEISLPPGDRLPIYAGQPVSVAVSPDGRLVVFSARTVGVDQLYARAVDDTRIIPIAGTQGGVGPFFSPDGASIGFFADGALMKASLSGGSPTPIVDVTSPTGGSWGDDGYIYFSAWFSPIRRVAEAGGTPEPVTALDTARGEFVHEAPSVLPGSRSLLFSSGPGVVRIFSQDLLSGERREVTDGRDPYFTGGHLVFSRGATVLSSPFDHDAGELDADVRQLASGVRVDGRTHYAISSDGTLVYAPESPQPPGQGVWVDRGGDWTPIRDAERTIGHPRISPDGTGIAYMLRDPSEVYVRDVQRGVEDFLGAGSRPIFDADGRSITYRGADGIYTVAGTGGEPRLRLEQEGFVVFPLDWSRDGRVLIYSAVDAVNAQNVWTRAEGDEPRPFANGPGLERSATMSPDGRWIAYSVFEAGRPERIYMDRYPELGDRRTVAATGVEPVWSPVGDELYYRSVDGFEMWVISVDTETGVLGTPERLFTGPYMTSASGFWSEYDVSQDGQQFLMIRALETAETEKIVVTTHAIAVGSRGRSR